MEGAAEGASSLVGGLLNAAGDTLDNVGDVVLNGKIGKRESDLDTIPNQSCFSNFHTC